MIKLDIKKFSLLYIGLFISINLFFIQGMSRTATGGFNAWSFLMFWIIMLVIYYTFNNHHRYAICLIVFCIPLEQLFFAYGGGRYNLLLYLMLFIYGHAILSKKRRKVMNLKLHGYEKWFIGFIIWNILTFIWGDFYMESSIGIFTLLSAFFLLYLVKRSINDSEHLNDIIFHFILGVITLSIFLFSVYDSSGAFYFNEERGSYGLSVLSAGTEISDSILQRYYIVATFFCLFFYHREKIFIRKYIFLFATIIFVSSTFFAGSRQGMITIIICVTFYVLLRSNNLKKSIKSLFFLPVFALIIYYIIVSINAGAILERYNSSQRHYDEQNYEILTSGRNLIWLAAYNRFTEKPLLGHGYGSFSNVIYEVFGEKKGSHNFYVSILLESGIIGFIIISMFLFKLSKICIKSDYKYISIPLFLGFCLITNFSGFERSKEFFFAFSIIPFLFKEFYNKKNMIVS